MSVVHVPLVDDLKQIAARVLRLRLRSQVINKEQVAVHHALHGARFASVELILTHDFAKPVRRHPAHQIGAFHDALRDAVGNEGLAQPRRAEENQIRLFVVWEILRVSLRRPQDQPHVVALAALFAGNRNIRENIQVELRKAVPAQPALVFSGVLRVHDALLHAGAKLMYRFADIPGIPADRAAVDGLQIILRVSGFRQLGANPAVQLAHLALQVLRVHGAPLQRRADGAGQTVAPLVQQRRDSRETLTNLPLAPLSFPLVLRSDVLTFPQQTLDCARCIHVHLLDHKRRASTREAHPACTGHSLSCDKPGLAVCRSLSHLPRRFRQRAAVRLEAEPVFLVKLGGSQLEPILRLRYGVELAHHAPVAIADDEQPAVLLNRQHPYTPFLALQFVALRARENLLRDRAARRRFKAHAKDFDEVAHAAVSGIGRNQRQFCRHARLHVVLREDGAHFVGLDAGQLDFVFAPVKLGQIRPPASVGQDFLQPRRSDQHDGRVRFVPELADNLEFLHVPAVQVIGFVENQHRVAVRRQFALDAAHPLVVAAAGAHADALRDAVQQVAHPHRAAADDDMHIRHALGELADDRRFADARISDHDAHLPVVPRPFQQAERLGELVGLVQLDTALEGLRRGCGRFLYCARFDGFCLRLTLDVADPILQNLLLLRLDADVAVGEHADHAAAYAGRRADLREVVAVCRPADDHALIPQGVDAFFQRRRALRQNLSRFHLCFLLTRSMPDCPALCAGG
nr:MAG TPA: hypothetical protein [Caudoviricetes sp.]